jgi:hypothetical protein
MMIPRHPISSLMIGAIIILVLLILRWLGIIKL